MPYTLFFTTQDPEQATVGDAALALTLPQADSWFGQGRNEPVSASEVLQAGGEQLVRVAAELHTTPEALAEKIAKDLPGAIDKSTPAGSTGEPLDSATGLEHLGRSYRSYNPTLMRFHSPDSLSPFDGDGLNPYAYCLGDPINRVDPTGN
ncbi:RHS repeat-associated core domain-containing protein [Streptomyces sp. NPDC056930]|uniref:RHS repeat-associated core domain-containing protein n=1 Tax=Streptomyces sp. NPDC056930 TaxID=3345967 RepID=UPI00362E3F01